MPVKKIAPTLQIRVLFPQMSTTRFKYNLSRFYHLMVTSIIVTVGLFAQDPPEIVGEAKLAVLVDEFGRVGECDFGGRMDAFLADLANKPDHQGYIINYLGVETLPADRENHFREKMIMNHMSFRSFDRSRITLVRGGFRETLATEVWLIPPGADFPAPSRRVPEPRIPVNNTFLFDQSDFVTDSNEDLLDEFILASVKAREEAERLAQEAEWEAEQAALGENNEPEAKEENSEPEPQADGEVPSEQDSRTPEEKEADRFRWADGPAWLYLYEHPRDSAVIIFYADDQYYDVHRFQSFVIEVKRRMANLAGIKSSRVRVVFGGYRGMPEFEFWIVPPKGKRPIATPEERPIEEDEPDEN